MRLRRRREAGRRRARRSRGGRAQHARARAAEDSRLRSSSTCRAIRAPPRWRRSPQRRRSR